MSSGIDNGAKVFAYFGMMSGMRIMRNGTD